MRKEINRGDEEEDEDGMDEDLAGFVDHAPDDEVIGDAEEEGYNKFRMDMDLQDKLEHQRVIQAIIFGANNKKRKRHEVEGLDDDSSAGNTKRKMRKLNQRELDLLKQLDHEGEEGFNQAKRSAYMDEMLDEEVDKEEAQKQLEALEFHRYKQELNRLLKSNSLKKQVSLEEEEKIESIIEDINKDPKKSNFTQDSRQTNPKKVTTGTGFTTINTHKLARVTTVIKMDLVFIICL